MLISRENITSQQIHKISWFVKMKVVFTRHNLKSILTWKDSVCGILKRTEKVT